MYVDSSPLPPTPCSYSNRATFQQAVLLKIKVVVSDVKLPGASGRKIVRLLRCVGTR